MTWNFIFFINNVFLGVGLAMDAFSISLANGLNESQMTKRKMIYVAGVYAFYQFAMPMIGWLCVHAVAESFKTFQKFIPWIALILLLYIGIKMLVEAVIEIRKNKTSVDKQNSSVDVLSLSENQQNLLKKSESSVKSANSKSAKSKSANKTKKLTFGVLMVQGIATSIDALSVGFTIAEYGTIMALVASLIIAFVTWIICFIGLVLGKKAGEKLAEKASILGGIILILIGIEIFVKGVFF